MAGEQTVRLTRSVQFGGITVGGITETVSANFTPQFQQEFSGVVTDAEITFPVDVSAVLVCAISANKDCTVKTNSTSVPDDTLALKANQPLVYRSTSGEANFLTADVTKFYLTTTETTTLKIGVASDITP